MDADLADWPLAYVAYVALTLIVWALGLLPVALYRRARRLWRDISRAAAH